MKKLLIIVDMQNDFIDGALGTPEAQAIVPNVIQKIRQYQASGDVIIFTMDTHSEDYLNTLEGKNLPVPHCIKGTNGWNLHPELEKIAGRRFEKQTFGSIECAETIAKCQYDTIELAGICTDICVISNALLIKAALPETPVTVDGSCCAGVTPASHETALAAMKACQIEII